MGRTFGRGGAGLRSGAAILCVVFASALLTASAADAATITVSTTADGSIGGQCTLRDAITAATTNLAVQACAAGGGTDTIQFSASGTGTIAPTSPLPLIPPFTSLDARDGPGCTGDRQVLLDGAGAGAGATGFNYNMSLAGSSSTLCGFYIGNFGGPAIRIATDNNTVIGNRLGVGPLGGTIPNGVGVQLDSGADGNVIGGPGGGMDRNLISGNGNGVIIQGGSDSNTVLGNTIGASAGGAAAVPNGFGVAIQGGSKNNLIGGAGVGNVISGNTVAGVLIDGSTSTGNTIQGNLIGTTASGDADLGNGSQGVRVIGDDPMDPAQNNVIGGAGPGEGNLISGNGSDGIQLQGGDGNQVLGNLIGTAATGATAIPNTGGGVDLEPLAVDGASDNAIGAADTSTDATTPGARNVISGNSQAGVRISGSTSSSNVVEGNFIGTDAAGLLAIHNGIAGFSGVQLENATAGNRIGGIGLGLGNLISGNLNGGVYVNFDVTATTIRGNLIGTDRTGTGAIANTGPGIQLDGSGTTVGGTSAGAGNAIAHNFTDGVSVVGLSTDNRILGNSIYSNSDLGIDLFPSGVTANDMPFDVDVGPNDLQNFPVLAGAQANSVDTDVQGFLHSKANQTYRIEFFSNSACDGSGNGEGQTLLGSAEVTTDPSGSANIDAVVASSTAGDVITATATQTSGTMDGTSEFSACQTIASKPEPPPPPPPPPTTTTTTTPTTTTTTTTMPTDVDDKVRLELDAKGKQKVRKLELEVGCKDEHCDVVITGEATVPKSNGQGGSSKRIPLKKKTFKLKRKNAAVNADKTKTVKLKFVGGSKKVKKIRKLLKDHKARKQAKLTVTVTVIDRAGNDKDGRAKVKLRR